VNKEQLLDLTERVKLVAGVELPIIVGSQSLYAVTSQVPDSVKRSVECDFLLLAAGLPTFRAVIEQIGFASSFQETHGYYADAVGLATVVLPAGWQERLVPLTDEAGKTHAYCLEVHDTCVSKLMAGREKDFTFIKELLDRGLADMEAFISRAATISDMPQSAALLPRLEKLEGHIKSARSSLDLRPLQRLIAGLRSHP
jgi:predicted DNA-binding protein